MELTPNTDYLGLIPKVHYTTLIDELLCYHDIIDSPTYDDDGDDDDVINYIENIEMGLFDWLPMHNYMENKGKEMHSMDVRVHAIQTSSNIPEYISILQIQQVAAQDEHLQ